MEVHTHTHTAADPDSHRGKKKWTHYFWEFLMLFLAVTLGFFVENQREHYIENIREKQYIRSLIVDVELDIAALNQILIRRTRRMEMLDSLSMLINDPGRDKQMSRLYYFGRHIPRLFAISFTYNDRTIQQLKNSGNMRLIRKRAAADGIILYDAKIRDMFTTEERETQFMFLCLPYLNKIFDGLVFDKMLDSLANINEPPPGASLLNTANENIPEFNTSLHTVKSSNMSNLQRVKALIQDGEKLLITLKKEYYLE